MNTLARIVLALWHSLPLYSWRRCCVEWEKGREFGRNQIGIARDTRGRFTRIATP